MNFETVSTAILGLAFGFGTAIWILVSGWHFRYNNKTVGAGYTILAAAYLACATIIVGRYFGYFQELPRGISLFVLGPIVAIPPAIQWRAWLRSRTLIRSTLHEQETAPG